MIGNLILWYLVLALAGWLAFPLAFRVLACLPDRGLALSRPLGLLLAGYAYWLLVSLHVLQNDNGGVVFALLLVGGLSAWRVWKDGSRELLDWLRQKKKLVVTTELLFLALFALWAVFRSTNPDTSSTEKPMELAFINAILRSPSFPPSDPWLSGYAISYYYFGYVLVAMLARISGTPGGVAFNLALASWFAMTGLAAYGILYNLLAGRASRVAGRVQGVLAPLLAPAFVLLVSNLEGFLEILHSRGLFWKQTSSGWQGNFWQWLNIQELVNPPGQPFGWAPQRPGGIWWWRASRVLQDFDWNNQSREIIDEFPAFSYLLGDLHPHVLAMPFVLLVVGLALNVFVRRRGQSDASQQSFAWLGSLEFWLTAVALGSLSFLNTWDFPIYLALFAAAVALAQLLRAGWSWQVVIDFFEALVFLGVAGVILYLPFYLGFSSQANGVLPSLIFFTRGIYFWVMFGSLLLPIFLWLVWKWRGGSTRALLQGLLFGVGLVGALWLVSSVYGMLKLGSDPNLAGIYGAAPGAPLVQESLARRFAAPGTWISLVVLLALVWGLLQTWLKRPENNASADTDASLTTNHRLWDSSDAFVLLLILLGAGLAIFPEFFYLRDQFGWRMNTIFKFYFQTWVVWAIAAGYASVVLWEALRKPLAATAYRTAWAALVAAALVYPAYGIWDRSTHFANPAGWTLDGDAYIQNYEPLELDAMRYLQTLPVGTIVEAVGGSYTGYARVSTHTGYPSVLGWPGHESQWRGGAKEMGSREADIAQLYRAKTWEQISQILAKYQIRYVYVGSLEQSTYHTLLTVFDRYLNPVYHNSGVTIYEVPNEPLGQAGQP